MTSIRYSVSAPGNTCIMDEKDVSISGVLTLQITQSSVTVTHFLCESTRVQARPRECLLCVSGVSEPPV